MRLRLWERLVLINGLMNFFSNLLKHYSPLSLEQAREISAKKVIVSESYKPPKIGGLQ